MGEEKKLVLFNDPILQELLLSCDENYLENLELSEKELNTLKRYVKGIRDGGHSLVPMICLGERCICSKVCPLFNIGKVPIGKRCPFEVYAMKVWLEDYAKSLKINMEDKVERNLVMDLVETDILNARANVVLSHEGFIMENPVGIDPDSGQVLLRKEEHIVMKFKERAQNRKDKLLKSFLATRESKVKAVSNLKEDPSEYLSRLRKKAEMLTKEHSIIDMEVKNNNAKIVSNNVNPVEEKPKEERISNNEEFF